MLRLASSRLTFSTNSFTFSVIRRCISTEPLLQNSEDYRVLRIANLPPGTSVSALLDQIRVDGPIENIQYHQKSNSAILSLIDAQAARTFMETASTIRVNGQTLSLEFASPQMQRKLPASLVASIGAYDATRGIEMNLLPRATEGWYRDQVKKLCGPTEIERIVIDREKSKVSIYFAGIVEALEAKQAFREHGESFGNVFYTKDPCDLNDYAYSSEKYTVVIKGLALEDQELPLKAIGDATGGWLFTVPLLDLQKIKKLVLISFANPADVQQFLKVFNPQLEGLSVEVQDRQENAQSYKIRLATRLGATRRLLISGPSDKTERFIKRRVIWERVSSRHIQKTGENSVALLVFKQIGNCLRDFHNMNYSSHFTDTYRDLTVTFGVEPQPHLNFKEQSELLLPYNGPLLATS
ncbi:hypothetical protein VKT23_006815 [Stygiomarasmius scandens]|uniref:RRM domain-containing protein n=1 Tax=Marasmiellus scandens TaxID=2682957 RepID=A0ABR1JRI5_9AGAR